ncbi:glycosyltransferase [Candidatus Saccharibacteria bacterium]|nr:glycosyltransferase [Candidatus Saccharibacteria bacterium]
MLLAANLFLGLGLFLLLTKYLLVLVHRPRPLKARELKNPRFAVLVPARYESSVIEDLFKSFENQTYKISPPDIYIIVEAASDPTVVLARNYGYQVFVRPHPEKQRKGYALDEAVRAILKQEHYDAYFIFDADNTLSPTYFAEMKRSFERGYALAIGCRKIKNPENAVAVGSGLIFTIVNVIMNRIYSRRSLSCIASGTGFYLSGEIVEQERGFPFHSLTEDYEISLFAATHGYSTYYNRRAVFYDAQPRTYTQYFIQRARWEKGYFEARLKYLGPLLRGLLGKRFAVSYILLIGIFDLLFLVVGLVLLIIYFAVQALWLLPLFLFDLYFVLILFTALLLHLENYPLKPALYIKTLFFHPLLLLTYIPCLFVAIFKRRLSWCRIDH